MKKKRRSLVSKTIVAVIASFMAAVPAVYAEDAVPDFTMETILVTDSRVVQDNENEATKVTSINVKDKIDAGQIKSITDLLQDVPGVIVNTSPQSGTTVSMRGMSNERILVAINGNVIENQGGIFRGRSLEWDSLPVNNVKKIEIIRGASSALYGGTWGGVINIVTVDNPGENKTFLKYSYGSYNDWKTSLTNQGTDENGKFSWIINANKREGDGYYRNNSIDAKDVNLNMTYHLAEKKKMSFAFTDSDRKEGVITGNNHLAANDNGWDSDYPEVPVAPNAGFASGKQYLDGSYREFKTKNYALNYDNENWKLNLYKNTQNREDYLITKSSTSVSELDTKNTGYSWQQNRKINNHNLIDGLDFRQLKLSGSSAFEANLHGYFLQDNWQVNHKTVVGLGLRYDVYDAENQKTDVDLADESQLSPKASVTYQLNSREAVYASASRVFRAPTVADYSRWSGNYYNDSKGNTPANLTTYNTAHGLKWNLNTWQQVLGTLKPEHGMAYELGWKKEFTAKWNGRVTGFLNDIDDYVNVYSGSEIGSQPPTYNIDHAKIKGLEFATDYQFNQKAGAVFNVTTQTASKSGDQLDPDGTDLTNLPKQTVNFGLRYNNLQGFRSSLDTRYRKNKTLGNYAIVDFAMSYTKNNRTVALAVNNIFDKDYQQTAGFPMPGINYSLSYQIGF